MTADVALVFVYAGGALAISFLCSLLEAGLLSARDSRLALRAERGERGAARLLAIKQERLDDAISAILTLNTIAHTVGATLAGAQAARAWGSGWVGVFSGVLTLLVLVLTEIIPKTLGAVHADRLAGPVGWIVAALIRLLAPVLFVTRLLTRALTAGHQTRISRGELAVLVARAGAEGVLRKDEARVLSGVLGLERVLVEDVMTPRTVALMLPVTAGAGNLLDDPSARAFSRIPLHAGDADHVVGYLLLRDVLAEVACGTADRDTPLERFRRDVPLLPEAAPLAVALRGMIEQREHLAVVVDEFGGTSGLVTLEDMIETVLGVEIVDESDRVADLRALAAELRDRRLAARSSQS